MDTSPSRSPMGDITNRVAGISFGAPSRTPGISFGSPTHVNPSKYCPSSHTKIQKTPSRITEVTIDDKRLVIKEGQLKGANAGILSYRFQSHETDMQDFKREEKKSHWSGTYSASTPEHACGYFDASSPMNALTAVRSKKPNLKYLEVSGDYMSDPTVTSSEKAKVILLHHFGIKSSRVLLSKVLENRGFDLYIGPDSDENAGASSEGIIMKPENFTSRCTAVYEGTLSKYGVVTSYKDRDTGDAVVGEDVSSNLMSKFDAVHRASVLSAITAKG